LLLKAAFWFAACECGTHRYVHAYGSGLLVGFNESACE
jgi:hypothetical protein